MVQGAQCRHREHGGSTGFSTTSAEVQSFVEKALWRGSVCGLASAQLEELYAQAGHGRPAERSGEYQHDDERENSSTHARTLTGGASNQWVRKRCRTWRTHCGNSFGSAATPAACCCASLWCLRMDADSPAAPCVRLVGRPRAYGPAHRAAHDLHHLFGVCVGLARLHRRRQAARDVILHEHQ
ncbi:MAG: hypothetical protein QOJ81_780 [Chloroflexota bacterium]|nr:hypothetical protein [Chloroflexota bacterium]